VIGAVRWRLAQEIGPRAYEQCRGNTIGTGEMI
jgi:hypothetical protein